MEATMDLTATSKLLDLMPGTRSEYEFKHMIVEQQNTFHRQLKYLLSEKEKCISFIQEKKAAISLMKYKTSMIADDVERNIVEEINNAREIRLRREIFDLEGDLAQIDKWLSNHSQEELEEAAGSFEHGEPEHWAGIMGRKSALEILADDKVSIETMLKMTLLPLPDYRRAVQITSQYAEFIKSTTAKAEQQLLPNVAKPATVNEGTIPSSKTVAPAAPTTPAAKPAMKTTVDSNVIDDIFNSVQGL